MLWIFERKGEQMRCEIRREGAGIGYEIIVTSPDGSQRMERFGETTDLIKRAAKIETGAHNPKTERVATLNKEQLRAIAKQKMPDFNTDNEEAAIKIVAGSCRQMGVKVEGL